MLPPYKLIKEKKKTPAHEVNNKITGQKRREVIVKMRKYYLNKDRLGWSHFRRRLIPFTANLCMQNHKGYVCASHVRVTNLHSTKNIKSYNYGHRTTFDPPTSPKSLFTKKQFSICALYSANNSKYKYLDVFLLQKEYVSNLYMSCGKF